MSEHPINASPSIPGIRACMSAVVPAYIFPAGIVWAAGFALDDAELRAASATTIAAPSALAALLVFMGLRHLELRGWTQLGRVSMTVLCTVAATFLGTLGLYASSFVLTEPLLASDVVLSAAIGAAITSWRYPRWAASQIIYTHTQQRIRTNEL